jgi:gamma-glutamyltranspeptidase
LQVLGAILAVIDFGMGLKEAIDAPRGKSSQKYLIL